MIYDLIEEYLLIAKLRRKSRADEPIPKRWGVGNRGVVILLPGLNEKYTFLENIADKLNKKGYKIRVIFGYRPNDQIERNVDVICRYIKEKKLKNLVIVGHSKGGLTARLLLSNKEIGIKIKKVFLIATPNGGSILGYLPLRGIGQMRPTSKFLKKLNGQKAGLKKMINILPKVDNHVIPNKNLYLKGAKNVTIDVVGHTRILNDERTCRVIVKNINSRMEV